MSATRVKWINFILLGGCVWQCLAQDDDFCMPASPGGLVGTLRVYNSTRFPASLFRNITADKMQYQVWPEDIANPRFRFPCQDASSQESLKNFTVSCDSRFGRLDPRPYYDIGTANHLQPYYKHWTYSETIPPIEIQIWCERNDMRRLYSHRIWKHTLLPAVLTTIVLVIIVELTLVTLLCVSVWRRVQLKKHLATVPKRRWAHEFLVKYLGGHDTIADGLHLLLLVMAGFCMIEAVSHSSSTSWRSICMLDAAVMYTYLTLFAVLSSFARQLATARRETARNMQGAEANRDDTEMQSNHNSMASGRTPTVSDDDVHAPMTPRPTQPLSRSLSSTTSQPGKLHHGGGDGGELEDYGKEGNDWRWQRVFNQFGVVILMTAFLTYNENFAGMALDSLVGVIWSVIMVAAVWSIGVSIVIVARSVLSLATPRSSPKGHRQRPRNPNTAP